MLRKFARGQECQVRDCEKPAHNKRGWCQKHYVRWLRHGSPHTVRPNMREPFDRLIEKVEKSPDGCWNWTAAKSNVGYGLFWMSGRYMSAHRASWEIANGKIPDGACVLHRCDNRLCVNPEHMYVGTLEQNMRDRQIRDRCNKKLSISDVKKIRADNRSTRKIGKDYGVSGQTVHAIKAGVIWRHV